MESTKRTATRVGTTSKGMDETNTWGVGNPGLDKQDGDQAAKGMQGMEKDTEDELGAMDEEE